MSHVHGRLPLLQAALASLLAFTVGGIVPLIGGFFISDPRIRLATVSVRGQMIDASLLFKCLIMDAFKQCGRLAATFPQ